MGNAISQTDNLTAEQRQRCMSRVRNRDTQPERAVRSALHRAGLRFRKNVRTLPGSPDIVFPRARLAVFVDGDFWHGRDFGSWKQKVSPFWQEKIRKNMTRDAEADAKLERMGWAVLRVWGKDVTRDLNSVVERIRDAYLARIRSLGCDTPRPDSEMLSESSSGLGRGIPAKW